MGITPDRTPGASLEEETQYEDRTADGPPTVDGAVRFVSDDLVVKLSTGVKSLTTGSGLSEGGHRDLDQLVHVPAETAWEEVIRSGDNITDVILWTDNGKTVKIRETNITRAFGKVSVIVEKAYDVAGTLVETLTKTITRSGGKVASTDWVLT